MTTDYDVIIIGAGPAGASCAKHLVENGVKTLVVEKKKLPRFKCCAGLLSKRAYEFIQKNYNGIPDYLFCKQKKINVKLSKSGKSFFQLKDIYFNNLIRDKFDYWLTQFLNNNIIDESPVVDIKEDKKIIIQCNIKGNIKEYSCNTLIGADGAMSFVRRQIDPVYKKDNKIFAIQNVYTGKIDLDESYHIIYNNKYAGNGFAWIHMKNEYIYIGSGIENKINYFPFWFDFVKSYYKPELKLERKEFSFADYHFNINNINLGKKNILLIGEAAGLMSTFGEGITSALYSGYHAAESIIKSIDYKCLVSEEIEFLKRKWGEKDGF